MTKSETPTLRVNKTLTEDLKPTILGPKNVTVIPMSTAKAVNETESKVEPPSLQVNSTTTDDP